MGKLFGWNARPRCDLRRSTNVFLGYHLKMYVWFKRAQGKHFKHCSRINPLRVPLTPLPVLYPVWLSEINISLSITFLNTQNFFYHYGWELYRCIFSLFVFCLMKLLMYKLCGKKGNIQDYFWRYLALFPEILLSMQVTAYGNIWTKDLPLQRYCAYRCGFKSSWNCKLIFEVSTQKNKKKFADAINILFTAVLDLRPQLSLKFLGWSPPDLLLRLSNTDLEE